MADVEAPDRPEIPPGYLRRFTFDGGDITGLAKYARFQDGDPARLWTFGAHELTVRGVEVKPPYTFDSKNDYATMRAYYTGDGSNTIIYFFETWSEEAEIGYFAENCVAWELHELTHWAVDVEDNEIGPGHWERWNAVIGEVVNELCDVPMCDR